MRAVLTRFISNKVQTTGELDVITWDAKLERDVILFKCKTLELPWKENQVDISCIPPGTYKVTRYLSDTHGLCFEVHDVPGRTLIRVHAGNYYTDILGCILVGADFKDINNDGNMDVISSKRTLKALLKIMPTEFKLEVV